MLIERDGSAHAIRAAPCTDGALQFTHRQVARRYVPFVYVDRAAAAAACGWWLYQDPAVALECADLLDCALPLPLGAHLCHAPLLIAAEHADLSLAQWRAFLESCTSAKPRARAPPPLLPSQLVRLSAQLHATEPACASQSRGKSAKKPRRAKAKPAARRAPAAAAADAPECNLLAHDDAEPELERELEHEEDDAHEEDAHEEDAQECGDDDDDDAQECGDDASEDAHEIESAAAPECDDLEADDSKSGAAHEDDAVAAPETDGATAHASAAATVTVAAVSRKRSRQSRARGRK